MSVAIPTVGFISLGCPKATVDSERILSRLRAEGYQISGSYEHADLVVVNTCGFIDAAVEESLEAIGEALQENGRVIVTGCLGARDSVIRAHHPKVLAVTGPDALEEVMAAIHAELPPQHDPFTDLLPPGGLKLTPRHYAYLKIAEGCNQQCRFCIIPQLRGPLQSRPIGAIVDEAAALVSAGVRELLVVAQDTAAYGADLRYRTDFWQGRPLQQRIDTLVTTLAELGVWLRLHYIYPYPRVDDLVALMAEGKLLPYLDLPLQHASRPILRAMQRPGDIDHTLRRIEQWRRDCPSLTLRSTFIVGFPGESEADFELLLQFLQAAQLDRVGAFAYSAIAGAAANALPGAIDEALKQERLERLLEVQSAISADRLQQRVGERCQVLVDAIDDTFIYARSAAEAPEIDGVVLLPIAAVDDERAASDAAVDRATAEEIAAGDWLEVTITAADEHDLYAEMATPRVA